jgi:hypothetical protein
MAQNYDDAKVELSGFKPTENKIVGQKGNNREFILGNDPKTRDPFFDTKRELPEDQIGFQGEGHGNKGINLGNLESKDLKGHIIDNNKKMAQNFQDAHVKLSNFKPTENQFKGSEQQDNSHNSLDTLGNKLLTERDKDFTRSQDPRTDFHDFNTGEIHGNKGRNLGNLESGQLQQHLADNNRRMAQNFTDANVELSDFKPTENKFKGERSENRENILGNDPNSRDPFFDTKRDFPESNMHGNKGLNVSNLESKDLKSHLIDNNKRMAQNFDDAGVTLSEFKPTENVVRGQEGKTGRK